MSYDGYLPNTRQARLCVNEEAKLLRDPASLYGELGRAAAEAYEHTDNNRTLMVPSVEFMLRSGLRLFAEPTVRAALPKEVQERSVAMRLALKDMGTLVGNGLLYDYYGAHPELRQAMRRDKSHETTQMLERVNAMFGYTTAPVQDVQIIAGGALRFLNSVKRLGESPVAVIKRSHGLLLGAGISREQDAQLGEILGLPYASAGLFRLVHNDHRRTVAYTPEAARTIKTLTKTGIGCPARQVIVPNQASSSVPATNTLLRLWPQLVGAFLPGNATVRQTKQI